MDILRKGLLLRRGKKKNLIVAKIDARGNVDPTLDAELQKMLGELGYPGMLRELKRHKNGMLVYGGITFALVRKPERLEVLLKKHGIDVSPEELAVVAEAWAKPKKKRTSRAKK
jgi:hypothetical protein